MVINLEKGQIDTEGKIIWQILTFFALEAHNQIEKIGPSKNWFEKESNDNKGANYLYGLCYSYMEYYGHVYDAQNKEQVVIFKEIYQHLWNMQLDNKHWNINALTNDEKWSQLRIKSKKALNILKLPYNPLRSPFWFPDIIDMAHYGDPNA